MKFLRSIMIVLGLCLSLTTLVHSNDYTVRTIGNTTYTYGSNGETYQTRSIGGTDYTYGSDGYEGTGRQIGSTYNYSDNAGNSALDEVLDLQD